MQNAASTDVIEGDRGVFVTRNQKLPRRIDTDGCHRGTLKGNDRYKYNREREREQKNEEKQKRREK